MTTWGTLLTVASPDCAEDFFSGPVARVVHLHHAGSLRQLRAVLDDRSPVAGPVTLDLIGHSTAQHHLLRLGNTAIDMLDRTVAGFFTDLAATGLLPRLGITAVRLLGCETAVTDAGQRTLRLLTATLRVPVYGTSKPLMKSHSDAAGFRSAFSHLLIEASATNERSSRYMK
jgi:hypothetical protein